MTSSDQTISSIDYNAHLLCVVDDICSAFILDVAVGFATHKTKVKSIPIIGTKGTRLLKHHREAYKKCFLDISPIVFVKCNRYAGDHGVGTKVLAKTKIPSRMIIRELYGRLCLVKNQSFLVPGENDFAVVRSTTRGNTQLWLGPASYVNHDCEGNCEIINLSKDSAYVRTIRQVDAGDEITINYGSDYFGKANAECECRSCEVKEAGKFVNKPQVSAPHCIEFLNCAYCPAKFRFKSWLARHLDSHISTNTYSCNVYRKEFSWNHALTRHMKCHSDKVKRLTCTSCNCSFSRQHDLKLHVLSIHSGLSFPCMNCKRVFKCKKELQYHQNRVHTGAKPYACKECNKFLHTVRPQ